MFVCSLLFHRACFIVPWISLSSYHSFKPNPAKIWTHYYDLNCIYKVGEKVERLPSQARHPALRPPVAGLDARILSSNWNWATILNIHFLSPVYKASHCLQHPHHVHHYHRHHRSFFSSFSVSMLTKLPSISTLFFSSSETFCSTTCEFYILFICYCSDAAIFKDKKCTNSTNWHTHTLSHCYINTTCLLSQNEQYSKFEQTILATCSISRDSASMSAL